MTHSYLRGVFQLLPLFLLVAMMAACSPPAAQDGEEDAQDEQARDLPDERTPEMQAVEDVALAHQLSAYGERTGSAIAYLAAAEILINNPPQVIAEEPEAEVAEDHADEADDKPEAERGRLEASALLQQARQLAAGDQQLLAQAQRLEDRAEGPTARGAVGGPQHGFFVVNRNTTNIHRRTFRANEPAVVHIEGDGDTLLDLVIYDGNGNFIGSERGRRWGNTVSWVPRWTGSFRIEVINRGSVWNEYYFAHN